MSQTIFHRHCRPFLSTLYWGHCNCVQFKWFWMHRGLCTSNQNSPYYWRPCLSFFISFTLSFTSPPALAPPSACSRKRLPYNLRCRGWGPHLGDIASLIPYCSWARSFLLYPMLGRLSKGKHYSYSWVSGMFNYLVKAQIRFWCPRIKVRIIGGIGSYICKFCRCSKGIWTQTLMGVLLSGGWYGGEFFLLPCLVLI